MNFKTEVIRIKHPIQEAQLLPAAQLLAAGQLVAFPTETVYGLAAAALNERALASIFKVKGRPADNPLIVHLPSAEAIRDLTRNIPNTAFYLLERFAPGPLTLVLQRKPQVPDIVTGGLDTVAVRIPAHPTALALLQLSGLALAAPSANRSGRPSPTRAWHVYEDLKGLIPLILDDGPSSYGLESTVLDLTSHKPVLLRPGAITAEELREVLGSDLVIASDLAAGLEAGQAPASPGMKYRHYAPRASLMIAQGHNPLARADQMAAIINQELKKADQLSKPIKIGLYASRASRMQTDYTSTSGWQQLDQALDLPTEASNKLYYDYADQPEAGQAAALLFSALRKFDKAGVDLIVAEGLPTSGLGHAYMNRLHKAAGGGQIPGGQK